MVKILYALKEVTNEGLKSVPEKFSYAGYDLKKAETAWNKISRLNPDKFYTLSQSFERVQLMNVVKISENELQIGAHRVKFIPIDNGSLVHVTKGDETENIYYAEFLDRRSIIGRWVEIALNDESPE